MRWLGVARRRFPELQHDGSDFAPIRNLVRTRTGNVRLEFVHFDSEVNI